MSNISLIWVGFSAGLEMGLEELRESRPTAAKQVLRRYSSCEEEQSTGGEGGGGGGGHSSILPAPPVEPQSCRAVWGEHEIELLLWTLHRGGGLHEETTRRSSSSGTSIMEVLEE